MTLERAYVQDRKNAEDLIRSFYRNKFTLHEVSKLDQRTLNQGELLTPCWLRSKVGSNGRKLQPFYYHTKMDRHIIFFTRPSD